MTGKIMSQNVVLVILVSLLVESLIALDFGVISEKDFYTDCGREENCSSTDINTAGGSIELDFLSAPHRCRCDIKVCKKYGDCCPEVLVGSELESPPVPHQCYYVPEQRAHALMIGQCPPGTGANLEEKCAGSGEEYSYLLDVPALSKTSQNIYKNVYCALCNGEMSSNLQDWSTSLKCTKEMGAEEIQGFFEKSYEERPRLFINVAMNVTCGLEIRELLPLYSTLVPGLRYCSPGVVDTCPGGFWGRKEVAMCGSYKQYVVTKGDAGSEYKNAHCAICNGADINVTALISSPRNEIRCLRLSTSLFRGYGSAPGGIQLLFDFSLNSGGTSTVGLQSRCGGNEIWDYLHQKCQDIICKRGYELIGGRCELNGGRRPGDFSDNGTCHTVYVDVNNFKNVSETNSSIIVQTNVDGRNETHVFSREQYEYVNDSAVAVCVPTLHTSTTRYATFLHYVSDLCLAMSVFFAFVHLVIFAGVRKLRNLPGKILASLTLCIFCSQFVFLTLLHHSKSRELCLTVSLFLHYTFLASFFWMSVMSFDIWRKFTGTMVSTRHQSREGKQKSFLKYSLFAWISPLIIVALAAWIDQFPVIMFPEVTEVSSNRFQKWTVSDREEASAVLLFLENLQPAFAKMGLCWFSNRLALFVFFGAPVALLVGCNLVFFGLTARAILVQNDKTQRVLNKKETRVPIAGNGKRDEACAERHNNSVNAKLYAKLALIMGLTWILGFIANFSSENWVWLVFVVLNGLQGTFIFFGFDFKRKVWQLVKRRLGKSPCGALCPQFGIDESTSSRDRTFSTRTSSSIKNSRMSGTIVVAERA